MIDGGTQKGIEELKRRKAKEFLSAEMIRNLVAAGGE